ncbi:MAG TPA: SMC-Scp complex subunit ScpB [Phycisphaerales bacterium]|nr:SMC-Scp complex subunit ScpB [Phycisphaerales bacterium]HMP37196.1 SMC-Scp complex subunit ScpB [Phycisphaerales bacterium]
MSTDLRENAAHGRDDRPAPSVPLSGERLETRLEVLLLASDRPLTEAKIAALLEVEEGPPGRKAVAEAVTSLNREYEQTNRPFRVEAVAGGHRMLTLPRFAPLVERLRGERSLARLSQAALETLAIVAYRQPILRAELEAIRGVACGEVLRGLLERRLIRITGRAEIIGRPMLYGTTREFLQTFGLSALDDLPRAAELRPAATRRPKSNEGADGSVEASVPATGAESDSAGQQRPRNDFATGEPERSPSA